VEKNPTGLGFMQFGFVPTDDGTIILDKPSRMLEEGKVKKIPVLLGNAYFRITRN